MAQSAAALAASTKQEEVDAAAQVLRFVSGGTVVAERPCMLGGMMDDEHAESRRQAARRERRQAGVDSARLARALMEVSVASIDKLGLDEGLRAAVDRARAVSSRIARRRAERELSGELRRVDLDELATRLQNVQATGTAAPRLFKIAESWRTRLIEEGQAAAAEFPGGGSPELAQLVHQARRERDTGSPRGAGRLLFRHVLAALETAATDQ